MSRSRTRITMAAAASLAMVAVACSNVSSSSTGGAAASGAPDNSGTTITLAVNPWDGSAANVAVAKALLENQLGYTVKTTTTDEYAQFPALANGSLDATLEVWPSGHAKDYAKYIAGGNGVVDGGPLGVTGQIGWWFPTYMLQDHPELATWQGLQQDAQLFKTAESGSQGQLLDGDPSYVSYDDSIVKNLGLDMQVVQGGSEQALLTALKTAYPKKAPLLMYFWTPHWAQAQYDLTMMQLPDVTQQCTDAAASSDTSSYNCGYPPDPLYKAFNQDLSSRAPAAFAMLSAMSYTNKDQDSITLDMHNGMSADQAAQKWVDANQSVWQPWVDAGMAAQGGSPVANASPSM